jgi:hypothetical protein
MCGPPNVNPFVRDYSEKLGPFLGAALDAARPEVEAIASIFVHKLPWYRRLFAGKAWWPVLVGIMPRLSDIVLECYFVRRGEIPLADCSPSVRAAYAIRRVPREFAGNPHDVATVGPPGPPDGIRRQDRREKVLRTIHRGKAWYRSSSRHSWTADPADPDVIRFKCYEIAYTFYQSIPPDDMWGDPKIVDAPEVPARLDRVREALLRR